MRRAAKIAVWTVGIVIGVIAAGFAFLQTGAGKGWVAATLTQSLSTPASSVTVGRIEGLVPFDITVDHIALGDAAGRGSPSTRQRWPGRPPPCCTGGSGSMR
jgi:translocation and assembly module TamB